MSDAIYIDLLRHGTPEGGRRYRGQQDDPLSEKGWQEMRNSIGDARPWQRIVSSPLLRCSAFAEQLSKDSGLPLSFDDRLREVGFGSWEGHTAAELEQQSPSQVEAFYQDPINARPKDAEPLRDFYQRVGDVLEEQFAGGENRLLVCHAGVIRAAVAYVLQTPLESLYRLNVASASITRLRVGAQRPPTVMWFGCNGGLSSH